MKIGAVTRGIVIVSTVAAGLLEAYLSTEYSPPILWIAVIGFAILVAIGSRARDLALPVTLAAAYLAPALLLIFNDGENFALDIMWVLPLLGLTLSGPDVFRWSLPERWQWPLVTWALIVAVTWPIVFLREADFAPWILPLQRVSNTSIGVSPWQVGLNIVYFVLAHNVGILFVDALCRWYSADRTRFRHEVLSPLLIAASLAAAVSFYQGFVDLSFLNHHFWTYMIRAAGTLGDPNKLGAVAAFWTIGAVVYARRSSGTAGPIVAVAGVIFGVAAVWLSGSRTGLAAVMVSMAIALLEAIYGWWTTRAQSRVSIRRVAAYTFGGLLLAAALVGVLQRSSTHTIVQRGTLFYLPFIGDRSISNSANELLWERFGYGPAAIQMIKEHPIDGVGVGMFHTLVMDFGTLVGHAGENMIPTDNAQNWFRHILAEFGVLGAIPMFWWCVVLVALLFSRRSTGDRISTGMLRGVLIGFFVASMFGMPAQSIAIVITFWVFVFWLFQEGTGNGDQGSGVTAWSRAAVIAAALLIAVHLGATTVDAFGNLRPRERAQRFNWYYRYGYVQPDDVEKDPGGNPVGRRWTMKQSLAVIPVKGKVLKFAAWVDHPDADVKPVHTQVWADSALVYEGDLRRGVPVFLDIPATPGKKYLVLETKIDRLWRPSDTGGRDRRELGLSVRDWVWE